MQPPYPDNPAGNDTVCIFSVKFTYAILHNGAWINQDTVLRKKSFIVSDFPDDGKFIDSILTYSYPDKFLGSSGISFNDTDTLKGISFQVDYRGHKNLYVDYIEVWDQDVWNNYYNIKTRQDVINRIQNYPRLKNIKNNSKQIFWYAADEPQTLDLYTPIRTIDSLAKIKTGIPLITEFNPQWNGWRNGDKTIQKFVDRVKPQRLMIDYFPYWTDVNDEQGLSLLSARLQEAYEASKDIGSFYYVAQSFGQWDFHNNIFRVWRRPDSTELNASVMLALAHGIKGIMFWNYWSYVTNEPTCGCKVLQECIIDTSGYPTDLYTYLHNSLIPRLKGKLGNILLNLDYTGDFIHETYHPPLNNSGGKTETTGTHDYLSLILNHYSNNNYDYHAGLFAYHNSSDNKFFLLSNLRMDGNRQATFSITNNTGFRNIRVRDYENPSSFDTTISSQTAFTHTLPAGEGRLYQVAPVAKYGGNIWYNETISGTNTLYGELTIKSGDTLTLSSNSIYNINNNITIDSGGVLVINRGAALNVRNGAILVLKGKLVIDTNANFNIASGDSLH